MITGRPYDRCGYCGKWVRLSGFMAGWHICLTPYERAMVDAKRQQQIHGMDKHYLGLLDKMLGASPAGKRGGT